MVFTKYLPFCSGVNLLKCWGRLGWPIFCRRHFQMHFRQWKCWNFDQNFIEVYSWISNWQWLISSGNGLARKSRPAISLTNDGLIHLHTHTSFRLNEFNHLFLTDTSRRDVRQRRCWQPKRHLTPGQVVTPRLQCCGSPKARDSLRRMTMSLREIPFRFSGLEKGQWCKPLMFPFC